MYKRMHYENYLHKQVTSMLGVSCQEVLFQWMACFVARAYSHMAEAGTLKVSKGHLVLFQYLCYSCFLTSD